MLGFIGCDDFLLVKSKTNTPSQYLKNQRFLIVLKTQQVLMRPAA